MDVNKIFTRHHKKSSVWLGCAKANLLEKPILFQAKINSNKITKLNEKYFSFSKVLAKKR